MSLCLTRTRLQTETPVQAETPGRAMFWSHGAASFAEVLQVQVRGSNDFQYLPQKRPLLTIVHWSRALLENFRSLPRLADFPHSERLVWDTVLLLCDYDPSSPANKKLARHIVNRWRVNQLLSQLDDILLHASVRLARTGPIADVLPALARLEARRRLYIPTGFPFFAVRSVQFLRELTTLQSLPSRVSKILQPSPLPPELVQMTSDWILALHGIPPHFFEAWSVPRPRVPACPEERFHSHPPPIEFVCPVSGQSCPHLISDGWWCKGHRWVRLHWCWHAEEPYACIGLCLIEGCLHRHLRKIGTSPWLHYDRLEQFLRTSNETSFLKDSSRHCSSVVPA